MKFSLSLFSPAVVDDGLLKWEKEEAFEVEYILDHAVENVRYKSILYLAEDGIK